MQDDRRWTLGKRPELDGIRGIAVTLVMLGHAGVFALRGAGGVGVTMFFALSGFLITALLLEEHDRVGVVSLRLFYARRALRLLPALVVFLATMAVVAAGSDRSTVPTRTEFLGALLYVGNVTTALQGHDNVLLHTWSLAVEEQFYLVWPVVAVSMLALGRGRLRSLALVAGAASLVSVLLRAALWDGGEGRVRIYYSADTRMDCLLVGALAAMWLHRRGPGRNRPALAVGAVVAACLLCLATGFWAFVVVPLLVPVLTVLAIVCVVRQGGSGVLASRPITYLGRRSYGIYLWHFPLVGVAATLPGPVRWPALAAAILLTLAVAHLSWRCVEQPFMVRKDRLRTRDGETTGRGLRREVGQMVSPT